VNTEKELRVARTMVTRSGRVVSIVNPTPNDIDLDDIAHGLAHLCRFGGHVASFYSVAEHSVFCSRHVVGDARLERAALLHDAAEAYIGDLIWPLKAVLRDEGDTVYDQIESRWQRVIELRFGLTEGLLEDPAVKEVDAAACATEQVQLRKLFLPAEWKPDVEPLTVTIVPLGEPWRGMDEFIRRAKELRV
jgi:uncharacterized protein